MEDSILSWAILFIITMFFAIRIILALPAEPTKPNKCNYRIEKTTADFIWKNEKNKWRY